jgi:hypothetical protein
MPSAGWRYRSCLPEKEEGSAGEASDEPNDGTRIVSYMFLWGGCDG